MPLVSVPTTGAVPACPPGQHADAAPSSAPRPREQASSEPAAALEYRSIEAARRVFATASFIPGGAYRVIPTRANAQPAFGPYIADPHANVHRAYCLLVITPAPGADPTVPAQIAAITSFTSHVMLRFGLPCTLPNPD